MELLQLKYFKAVAEHGKITSAAESLFISPPALSAAVSRLEKELGVKLFNRGNNHIKLNRQGEIFLRYVNRIFTDLECARLELEHSLEEANNTIHILATSSDLWVRLISSFSAEYPNIILSSTGIKYHDPVDMLNQVSFLFADEGDLCTEGLESITLFEDSPYVMLPPTHPLAEAESISLHELIDDVFFLPMSGQSLNRRMKELFHSENIVPDRAHECSVLVCRHMVAEKRGIAFTTKYAERVLPNVKYIPLRETVSNWKQKLYWHADREFSKQEMDFKKFVLDLYSVPDTQK